MWIPFCLLGGFSFPPSTPADADHVRHEIEAQYASQKQPWSEAAGPYASVRLILLTPTSGIADVILTRIHTTFSEKTSVRIKVRKVNDDWTVDSPLP